MLITYFKSQHEDEKPTTSSSGVSEFEKSISGTRCKAPYTFVSEKHLSPKILVSVYLKKGYIPLQSGL